MTFGREPYEITLTKKRASDARRKARNSPPKARKPLSQTKGLRRGTSSLSAGKPSVSAKPRARLKATIDPELVAWSRAVKKRDKNACQLQVFGPCASGDQRIDPHHIAPRSRRPDLRYIVDNGICLCRSHHDWVHDHPIEAKRLGYLSDETYEAARKVQP